MVLNIFHRELLTRRGAGNWKDLVAFQSLLRALKIDYEDVPFDDGAFEPIVRRCGAGATDAIIHYSFWPELLDVLRRRCPELRLHVRTHNAEGPQHWHRAAVKASLSYGNVRNVYGAARLVWRDSRCRRNADSLLGISPWDDDHYWKRLPGKAVVWSVPYHSPWPTLRSSVTPQPWVRRRNAIVCLAGGQDRLGRSQVEGLELLARQLPSSSELGRWSCEVSRGVFCDRELEESASNLKLLPELDEPWDLLCSVKALALLSPLGFGMKTTIVDALAAGCHVLVDPVVGRRLPDVVTQLCYPVDVGDPGSIKRALERLRLPPISHDVNRRLREQAMTALRSSLSVVS